jgi:hypothetical protein
LAGRLSALGENRGWPPWEGRPVLAPLSRDDLENAAEERLTASEANPGKGPAAKRPAGRPLAAEAPKPPYWAKKARAPLGRAHAAFWPSLLRDKPG